MTFDYKVAVVGPESMISGFRALGADIYPAQNGAEALSQLARLQAITVDDTKPLVYAVVCVIDEVLVDVDFEHYDQVVQGTLPATVIVPGPKGSVGQAEARLKRLAEQAVGTSLW